MTIKFLAPASAIAWLEGYLESDRHNDEARAAVACLKEQLAPSETASTQPKWVSPTDRQPDLDGRLWVILTERRENGKRVGFVPAFEYYHFMDGWATDETILFWLDSPLHPLPSVTRE